MQMYDGYGYAEILTWAEDGHLITPTEFRGLAKELDMSAIDLAIALDHAPATIHRWLEGIGSPNPRGARAIREFVATAYLILRMRERGEL